MEEQEIHYAIKIHDNVEEANMLDEAMLEAETEWWHSLWANWRKK